MRDDWFDRAESQLVDAVNAGEISERDFREQMRDLRDQLREMAEEAAERAYDDVMGS